MSNAAWADSGIKKPIEEIFVRVSDNGANMIKGWEEGLLDMCVGDRRRLTIPAELAYGAMGSGPQIPGGATVMFDIELLRIAGHQRESKHEL